MDGDGNLDLILFFRTQDTALRAIYEEFLRHDHDADGVLDSTSQVAEVTITGRTLDSLLIEGSDWVSLFLSGRNLRELLRAMFGA